MATAQVDRPNGKAVIHDGENTYLLEYDQSQPMDGSHTHIGMYLQMGINTITQEDAGEYPYEKLHEILRNSQDEHSALNDVLSCFDRVYCNNEELRLEIFTQAEERLAVPAVFDLIIKRVKEVPFPKSFTLEGVPTEGKLGEIVQTIKETWF